LEIHDWVFSGCSSLSSICIPSSLRSLLSKYPSLVARIVVDDSSDEPVVGQSDPDGSSISASNPVSNE
jgi:hypothetical protein